MIPFAPGFFKFAPVGLPAGPKPMLVSLFLGGTTSQLTYNKDDPTNPRKAQYDAAPADFLYTCQAAFGTSLSYTNAGPVVTMDYFDRKATYALFAGNSSWTGDSAEIDIEFLNAAGVCRGALRLRRAGTYITRLYYGANLASMIACQMNTGGGTAAYVEGLVSFTDTQIVFTNTRGSFYNESFIYGGLDLTDVVKFRYTNAYLFAGSITATSAAAITLYLDSVAATVPPVVPTTKSLLHLNGTHGSTTITDEVSGHTWTAYNGASISTAQSKFGGASLAFDGVNDYAKVANHADFATKGNDMCFEAWVWADSSDGGWDRIAETSAWNSASPGWLLSFFGSDPAGSRRLSWQLAKSGGGGANIQSNAALPTNQWVHVAIVRRAGVGYMYINGVQQTATLSLTDQNWTQQTMLLGVDTDLGAGNFFKGYLDEVRLTNGSPIYTGNFTPPTAPFTL